MKTAESLAGTDRQYLVPCPQFRISADQEAGGFKVHLPKNSVRIEKNRIVVMFTQNELSTITTAIRKVTGWSYK